MHSERDRKNAGSIFARVPMLHSYTRNTPKFHPACPLLLGTHGWLEVLALHFLVQNELYADVTDYQDKLTFLLSYFKTFFSVSMSSIF